MALQGVRRPAVRGLRGPHLEAGLLDPDGDRPGTDPRHAAPDDAPLRADRERREARHAASCRRRGADRQQRAAGGRPAPLRRAAPAADRRRPDGAPLRAAGARRGDALADRHVRRRLRQLRRRHRGQDWQRREERQAPGLPESVTGGAVVVVRLRAVRPADDRRLRGDRERRPWRHLRRAGGAEGVRALLPRERSAHEPHQRLMAIEAVDTRARGLRRRGDAEQIGLRRALGRLDWVLLGALAATAAYGLWAINGITMHDAGGSALTRQALYAFAGAVLFVAVLFVDPDTYRKLRRPIYVGTLGLMLFVLVAGAATRGSKRWVDVSFFKFQPSEFGKVLLVLVLAGFLAE